VAINEVPGMLERGLVICGNELIRADKMPVMTYDVGSILHLSAHGTISEASDRWTASP
jgi:hypothetical protein